MTRQAAAGRWLGIDLGDTFAAEVDPRVAVEHHLQSALAAAGVSPDYLVTHVLPGGDPGEVSRIGVSLRLTAAQAGGQVVEERLAEQLGGVPAASLAEISERAESGRCVRFPGHLAVLGELSVAEIVRGSAIDRVTGCAVPVDPGDLVDTGGYLRPCFEAGQLVLLVGPAAGGRLTPLETRTRHECCAGGH